MHLIKEMHIQRQNYLLKNFGFSCTCRLCSLEGGERGQVTKRENNINIQLLNSISIRLNIEPIAIKITIITTLNMFKLIAIFIVMRMMM